MVAVVVDFVITLRGATAATLFWLREELVMDREEGEGERGDERRGERRGWKGREEKRERRPCNKETLTG